MDKASYLDRYLVVCGRKKEDAEPKLGHCDHANLSLLVRATGLEPAS